MGGGGWKVGGEEMSGCNQDFSLVLSYRSLFISSEYLGRYGACFSILSIYLLTY